MHVDRYQERLHPLAIKAKWGTKQQQKKKRKGERTRRNKKKQRET
jgi:hypothetical protein